MADDSMRDPRDFRKRLTDIIFNVRHDVETIHNAVEKGDRSLIYQHDFRLAHLLGLTQALKLWDDYQKELREMLDEQAKEYSEGQADVPQTD